MATRSGQGDFVWSNVLEVFATMTLFRAFLLPLFTLPYQHFGLNFSTDLRGVTAWLLNAPVNCFRGWENLAKAQLIITKISNSPKRHRIQ